MNSILIISSLVLLIIAGVVTFYAFKQEEKKMKKYKEQHLTAKEARERSLEYEEKSVSSVIPLQIWTYGIATVFTIIIVVVFAIYY
jgi:hypothetical protein